MTKRHLNDIKMISPKRSAPVACRYFYCHRSGGKIWRIWRFFGCADEIGRSCSWRFSKLWISQGLKVVAVLVGEQEGLRGKDWWERERGVMRWNFGGIFDGSEVWFWEFVRLDSGWIWGEIKMRLVSVKLWYLYYEHQKLLMKIGIIWHLFW